jgi:DNA-binding protein HU-beta
MNKRELIEYACEKLKNEGISKPVTIPRRTFFISDNDGNECKFHVRQVDKHIGYTQQDVAVITDAFLSAIEDSLKRGDPVSIYGFGEFKPHYRAGRKGIPIPKNRREQAGIDSVDVEARYVPKFSPGKNLRMAVKLWELSEKDGDE